MDFVYDDGGRSKYFKGKNVGDCVVRSIAIASGRDYKEIYDLVAKATGSSPRNGVDTTNVSFKRLMSSLGFSWIPCMKIGSGCKVHLREEDLPVSERIVCSCSGHYTAVINGFIHDLADCSRGGTRCVYGYWILNN